MGLRDGFSCSGSNASTPKLFADDCSIEGGFDDDGLRGDGYVPQPAVYLRDSFIDGEFMGGVCVATVSSFKGSFEGDRLWGNRRRFEQFTF